jgi:predicted small secreted protein
MKSLALWILFFSLLALSGCNTFKGMGQDLQQAGAKIEDAAKKK